MFRFHLLHPWGLAGQGLHRQAEPVRQFYEQPHTQMSELSFRGAHPSARPVFPCISWAPRAPALQCLLLNGKTQLCEVNFIFPYYTERRALELLGEGRSWSSEEKQPPLTEPTAATAAGAQPTLAPPITPLSFDWLPAPIPRQSPTALSSAAASPSRASCRRRAVADQGELAPPLSSRPSCPSAKQARDWSARGGAGRQVGLRPWPGRALRGPARCVRGARGSLLSAVGSQPSLSVPH